MSLQSTISPDRIAGLAWDLDNTLFDRDAAVRRFFNAWLGRVGWTGVLEQAMALDRSGDGDRLEFFSAVLRACGMDAVGAQDLWREFRRTLPDFVEPDLAVLRVLEQLAGRFEMALVSNGGRTLQRAKLARAGLAHCFTEERILISEEVGFAKPARRIFLHAVESMGLAPERVLFIGDHPVNDIHGAAAAGLPTCWISRGRRRPADLAGAVVEHVRDLAQALELSAAIA